jgi:hypothetical protein
MNVILNRRRLEPDMRMKVRKELQARIRLTMAEVFGWDPRGDRWQELDDFAQQFLAKYDKLYPDPRDEHAAILRRLQASGITHEVKKGSGMKVEYAHEHDIAFLPYALGLRKLRGFGQDRFRQLLNGLNERTNYYNTTFAGESDEALPVIENRLSQYGRRSKRA